MANTPLHSTLEIMMTNPEPKKLYSAAGTCSLSAHIIAREAGVPLAIVKTDHKEKIVEGGADYRKTNPLGYVPALEFSDGSVLTEVAAICQLIADRVPEKRLAPANGSHARYQMQGWLNFVATELHRGMTPMLSPVFAPKLGDDLKAIYVDRLKGRLAVVDQHLGKHAYLVGADFTCADAYLYTVSRWTPRVGVDLAAYPNLVAFQKRCEARAGVAKALEEAGLPRAA
jgi:glutathione S-transferase